MKSIIIIGAPRSGTNMLRDILTHYNGLATWPCDEINYIWRHGNLGYPSDEFVESMATSPVCKYIRKSFQWVSARYQSSIVVEKTCANSLRVPFVSKVIPEGKYIFIRRDGIDAVGSALKQWKAKLNLIYILKKARFVPVPDVPYYTGKYMLNYLHKWFSKENKLAFWGPMLNEMNKLIDRYALDEVCAIQWRRCVDKADEAFSKMPKNYWIEVGYEAFVSNPEVELKKILKFIGVKSTSAVCKNVLKDVKSTSVGKGRKELGSETIKRLSPFISETMQRHGYTC